MVMYKLSPTTENPLWSECSPIVLGRVTLVDEHGQTQRRHKTLSVHIALSGKFLLSAVTVSGPAGLCQLPGLQASKTSSTPRGHYS